MNYYYQDFAWLSFKFFIFFFPPIFLSSKQGLTKYKATNPTGELEFLSLVLIWAVHKSLASRNTPTTSSFRGREILTSRFRLSQPQIPLHLPLLLRSSQSHSLSFPLCIAPFLSLSVVNNGRIWSGHSVWQWRHH